MSRDIGASSLLATQDQVVRPVVFVEILLDTPIRVAASSRNYDFGGQTYVATGDILQIGNIEEGMSLDPTSISIVASGLKPTFIAAFGTEYTNKEVNIYLGYTDEDGELFDDPLLYFSGFITSMSIDFKSNLTINLEVKDELYLWNREKVALYTDAEQKRRYPGDEFLSFVESIAGVEIQWPI